MQFIALLGLTTSSSAATWPDDDAWTVATLLGEPLTDACDDGGGSATYDLIGTADEPAAYWADDGSTLWFRMRLADVPAMHRGSSPERWRSFFWGVLIESDWDIDDEHYDYMLVLNGAEDQVQLWRNDSGSSDAGTDAVDEWVASWDAPVSEAGDTDAGYAGISAAGSAICGDEDTFLDFGAPWDELAEAMGVTESAELSFMFATSTSGSTLGRDAAGCDGGCDSWFGNISDNSYDHDDDRLSSSDEVNLHGTDPLDDDTDDGGVIDGDEVLDCDTDPLDADDDPDCGGGGDGGSPDGGTGDGGIGDGGSTDGGSTDGGSTDGGSTDGGSTDGGTGAGGSGDGGSGDGGAGDGGTTDGGSTDDGGTTDGGSTDDGGSPDGGSTDGGSTDGGTVLDPSVDPEEIPPEGGAVRGGCGCGATSSPAAPWGLLAGMALLAARRRRS